MNKSIAIDTTWPSAWQLTEQRLGKVREVAKGWEIINISPPYEVADYARCEILFGHPHPQFLPGIMKSLINLRWFQTSTAGVEKVLHEEIDLPKSVILTNSADAYGSLLSEHMLTLTLMLMRNMGVYIRQQEQHKWQRQRAVKNMRESTVCVIGLGHIGNNYARQCYNLGARVRGVVRNKRECPKYIDSLFLTSQLYEAVHDSDIIALALPETQETKGLISSDIIASLKPGAIIINVGRGSSIDQDALIKFLANGHVGGAGLDVTTPEPLPINSPLWDMPNVIITPHVSHGGGATVDLILNSFIRNLENYLNDVPLDRVVDRQRGY